MENYNSNTTEEVLFNIEAEKSVLGALLLDKDAILKISETLKPKHFYHNAHVNIYQAILNLFQNREPADLITVQNELKNLDKLDRSGGTSYLTDLLNSVPTATNIEAYAKIIRDTATRRFVKEAAARIADLAVTETDTAELLDKAEQHLYAISQDTIKKDFVHIKDILASSFERLDKLSKDKGEIRGVPTGLKKLDKMLSGFQEGNLVILAARPSVGKSSLAFGISQHAAVHSKKAVAIFSLEMSFEMIVDRMLSYEGNIDNWKLSTGNLSAEDYERYGLAMGELSEAKLFIDDTPAITLLDMRTKARRLMLEHNIDLIVVDYLQLMRSPKSESRVQEVSELSQGLKALARELKVPVIALSQLSRAVEQRGGDKKPQLSDLRDSGSIEQDADVVMFLWRLDDENRHEHKLLIAKHRNGAIGEIDLHFKPEITRFYEVARDTE